MYFSCANFSIDFTFIKRAWVAKRKVVKKIVSALSSSEYELASTLHRLLIVNVKKLTVYFFVLYC